MRKGIIQEIDDFCDVWECNSTFTQAIYDLCMSVHSSGWVDGSNDYIEDYYEDEEE